MKRLLPFCYFVAFTLIMFAGIAETAYSQAATPTLIHYWNFNNLVAASRPVPPILADYTSLTPADSAYLEYYVLPSASSSWADGNNGADQVDPVGNTATFDSNARNGAVAGNALRCRNPLDSAELRWHIPSTGFSNLVITYLLESSSTTAGDSTEIFSYSVDGGKTWKTSGMTVNGANVDTLDVTQIQYQGSSWGVVKVTFGSDLTVNNNPDLIFRIAFSGNSSLLSGNNRFDDFTLDGVGSSGPPAASIAMTSPKAGNIFVPGRKTTISFTTFSEVGQLRTIQFSADSGLTWSPVGTVTGATSYDWTVPNVATTTGLISVTDSAGVTGKAGPFIIYPITADNRIVHYWSFNSLAAAYNNPNIPDIPADFSANENNSGTIKYVLTTTNKSYAGYIDNVAGDTVNARLGAPAGQGLRVRNPTDSMELRFVIPATGYKGISISYALQASSLSGANVQHFSYSIDGGSTWIASGLTVNGATQDSLDVTQLQYQQAAAYAPVTVAFGSQTSMDDNANFVFRIIFGDTSAKNTSGNNRFDNVSVDAQGVVAPNSVAVPRLVQEQMNIAPNPAMDNVSFDNSFASPATVSVTDVTGREVMHSNATASSRMDLNTSSLAPGSYYIRLQNLKSGEEQIAKFVKQ